jgi:protein TonB
VSDDLNVPKALQAGANSILRKPILIAQITDTLTTARDLLRAKQESATAVAHAAAAGASAGSSATPTASTRLGETTLPGAEEPLESSTPVPRAQVVTKSHAPEFVSLFETVDSPQVLEPAATSVGQVKDAATTPTPASPLPADGPRGLAWYLKTKAVTKSSDQEEKSAPPTPAKPELLGYDQPGTSSAAPERLKSKALMATLVPQSQPTEHTLQEPKKEAELFAYMAGGTEEESSRPKSRIGTGAILGALILASCAILAAPQAPWHSKIREVWTHGRQTMHGWLNPQPVTPAQAPMAHEDFGRAGDEYKLPVSETIPDATTDPSQIQVVPVIDPTVKKTNNDGANPDQPAVPADGAGGTPTDQPVSLTVQPISSSPSETAPPATGTSAATSTPLGPTVTPTPVAPLAASQVPSAPSRPAPPAYRQSQGALASANVPSSLKSQLASMTPDSSGNRAPETAMPSIEPVVVPETAERMLLAEQPALPYPANAKGQQGTVVLQVLIGRDGSVQDAKFLQGSLAFARSAIDGVKLWKFKPYTMNGRAVSVQTKLTMNFKPNH